MTKVKNYLSLIKFSHTIFAMPFALIGFFLGLDYYLDLSTFLSNEYVQFAGTDSSSNDFIKNDLFSISE